MGANTKELIAFFKNMLKKDGMEFFRDYDIAIDSLENLIQMTNEIQLPAAYTSHFQTNEASDNVQGNFAIRQTDENEIEPASVNVNNQPISVNKPTPSPVSVHTPSSQSMQEQGTSNRRMLGSTKRKSLRSRNKKASRSRKKLVSGSGSTLKSASETVKENSHENDITVGKFDKNVDSCNTKPVTERCRDITNERYPKNIWFLMFMTTSIFVIVFITHKIIFQDIIWQLKLKVRKYFKQ